MFAPAEGQQRLYKSVQHLASRHGLELYLGWVDCLLYRKAVCLSCRVLCAIDASGGFQLATWLHSRRMYICGLGTACLASRPFKACYVLRMEPLDMITCK
jgi:hypothetical protein